MKGEASKAVTPAPADVLPPPPYNDYFSVKDEIRVWEVCGGRNTCFQRITRTRLKTDLWEHKVEPGDRLKDFYSRPGRGRWWLGLRGVVRFSYVEMVGFPD